MGNFTYEIKQNESMNKWLHSKITKHPFHAEKTTFDAEVNMTEGYLEVEYPVRRAFLEETKEVRFPENVTFDQFYCGFENRRVDFSTFITTPHKVQTYLNTVLVSPEKEEVSFLLTTCGRAVVWLNDQMICDFKPYTRNHGTSRQVTLPLNKGENNLVIYMDDLAERDVNFFVEMLLMSEISLEVQLPIKYSEENIKKAINLLQSLYLEKDFYDEGNIFILSDQETSSNEQVRIAFSSPLSIDSEDEVGGNITDFSREALLLPIENRKILIGNVATLKTSGLTHLYVGYPLDNQQYLYKKFVFTSYNHKKLGESLGDNLSKRKLRALEVFADLELMDMNSALANIFLTGEVTTQSEKKLAPAYSMITNKGDCADFMFAPLLSYTMMAKEQLPENFLNKIENLALGFRYWIDEPGNDVMWYFSENHSLLFHICQYLAGSLYSDKQFKVSSRLGTEQYLLGKQRLIEWFRQFEKVGFSEWNSATYLPIDLIGFFSLYNAAPDQEIKDMAKKALDFTFEIIAINHHGGVLSSTFGRTYEHDLKAMKLGEISNILAIAWDRGYFNYALRSATLFCLSDYEPPKEYLAYIDLNSDESLTANYIQGVNQVKTYLHKTKDYSIASAINYNAFKKGHQQHLMNLSLGTDGTQLWLNNPGEYLHSGENRPSYWAVNGICPLINQFKNFMVLKYQLQEAYVKKIHLYLPHWNLDEVDNQSSSNWLFIRKATSYLAVYFSEEYEIEKNGDTRQREAVSYGEEHLVLVKVVSQAEVRSFESFKEKMLKNKTITSQFEDFQFGMIDLEKESLVKNKPELLYTYTPNVVIERNGEKEGVRFGEN